MPKTAPNDNRLKPHQGVRPWFHRRVIAMRMVSSSGIDTSLPWLQVGAAAYSAGGMLREAIWRPRIATTSIGTATGRPNQPNQLLEADDQLDLSLRRAHYVLHAAERNVVVVEHR